MAELSPEDAKGRIEKLADKLRCRWCGKHMGRMPPEFDKCRARLSYGPCVEWQKGMAHWPQSIELDEYVDEETCQVCRRPDEDVIPYNARVKLAEQLGHVLAEGYVYKSEVTTEGMELTIKSASGQETKIVHPMVPDNHLKVGPNCKLILVSAE